MLPPLPSPRAPAPASNDCTMRFTSLCYSFEEFFGVGGPFERIGTAVAADHRSARIERAAPVGVPPGRIDDLDPVVTENDLVSVRNATQSVADHRGNRSPDRSHAECGGGMAIHERRVVVNGSVTIPRRLSGNEDHHFGIDRQRAAEVSGDDHRMTNLDESAPDALSRQDQRRCGVIETLT
jgi:hypothetical protein